MDNTRTHHDITRTGQGEHAPAAPSSMATKRRDEKILGRYQILGTLGQGGMGAVYHCHDPVTGTDVAIKVLHPEFAAHHHHVESLRANFALVERLHHPHIAALKTLDVEADSGNLYLIMEYVQGIPLQCYLEQHGGKLPPDQAIDLLRQLASALDYGHSEKIIHRDIKPANVIMGIRGQVKLLDFGIAERFNTFAKPPPGGKKIISGTAAYMAPEQWLAQFQDGRTDQYALAALAFSLLAGRPPAAVQNNDHFREAALAGRIDFPEDWPPAVRQVFARALALKRTDRYADCETFVEALASALCAINNASPVAARWKPVAVGAACALTLVLAFIFAPTADRERGTNVSPRPASEHPPAPTPAATIIPRYSALVIGISNYASQQGAGWNNLSTARRDADDIARVLREQYNFEVKTLLDEQATRVNIMQALDRLAHQTDQDAVLIYFAGHGYFEDALGEGFWIPHDARRANGDTPAREGWIWNTTITKMIGASAARHILVIADACYGGALFRGEEEGAQNYQDWWYRRALQTPSRLLITSGDMEPVLDSGARNSIFCSTLLGYLRHPAQPIFSASELGFDLKNKVGALTGQMVRMGQLPVSTHAGGEFVFVQRGAKLPEVGPDETPRPPATNTAGKSRDWTEVAEDALHLNGQGATNSARRIMERLSEQAIEHGALVALTEYLNQHQRQTRQQHIRAMIAELQERASQSTALARKEPAPPIIALIGPEPADALHPGSQASALLYRLLLEEELIDQALTVVSRQTLEENLETLNLGSSDLSAPSARLALGRLLPASYLLTGHIFRDAQGDTLRLRLIETETSLVAGTFSTQISAGEDKLPGLKSIAEAMALKLGGKGQGP